MLLMFDATISPLSRSLKNLSYILKKGEEYADAKKIEHADLLNAQLFADMYPLIRQVQIATDMSKGAAARLAGIEIPKYEDDETTFEQLQARIAKTLTFLESIKSEQLTDAETRKITLTVRKAELKFTGQDYLLKWVMPNVYFHVVTAYNILRHNGVELGKPDFLRIGHN
ncbi:MULTISPECIES: DUF1993 domain-containing protein [Methylotenera]|uniref:DUF1993 domain-containing protein n=1 Tax=Methylotenera TaxID=359407 RepID=UPI00036EBB16|nr:MULTISPECIES: DUF1993 domain-containing protein [Methylotenera]